jgi:hypothetical protein
MGDQKKEEERRILCNSRNEARGKNSSNLSPPKVRTGRRVVDRRRRGRRRRIRREELPGGAPEEKHGDMKRWETGEDAGAQKKSPNPRYPQ